MSIETPHSFWPTLKALIPDLPAHTTRLALVVEPDEPVKVEATFYVTGADGEIRPNPVGRLETCTEQFALVPYGETRPPSEREAFIAEMIEFVRDIERLHDLCFATGARIMQGDQPFGEAHRILNERGNQATRLIRKHEGKA